MMGGPPPRRHDDQRIAGGGIPCTATAASACARVRARSRAPTRCEPRSRRHVGARVPGVLAARSAPPPHSLLHRQGRTWAEIGAFVGQRSARVTSDVYTHVLLDDRELDYRTLLATAA